MTSKSIEKLDAAIAEVATKLEARELTPTQLAVVLAELEQSLITLMELRSSRAPRGADMDPLRNGRPTPEVALSYGHLVALRRLDRREPLGDLETDSRILPLIGLGLVGLEGGTYALTNDGRGYLENQGIGACLENGPCPFCGRVQG